MLGEVIQAAGIVIAILGLAIEGLGMMAMMYYPVRRRLPSPFTLFSIGGIAFFAGAIIACTGGALRAHAS